VNPPLGKVTDYGDLIHVEQWIVKGRRRTSLIVRLSAPTSTRPEDRVATVPQPYSPSGKVSLMATLHADKKVTVSLVEVDEMGNETGGTVSGVTYTTDDTSGAVIALTDNGDGSASVAAVGTPGSAQVTASVADPDGGAATEFVESFNVVPGDAAGFSFRVGPEEEVTPDA
jgi:hypothetical protein